MCILLSAMGMFAVFLFLTYYMEEVRGYSPVVTGVAFLPMIAGLIVSSTTSSTVLMPRVGPRALVPAGLVIAAGGMVVMASELGLHTSYAAWLLPALLLTGIGLGTVFGCAMNSATAGAAQEDAGVASAMVNTTQQIGGSIGTALLNTIAASALSGYLAIHGTSVLAQANAAVHSYSVAFWVAVGIFAGAAVLAAIILPSGVLNSDPDAEPTAGLA
jgi:predicted MFS family arabinose efflux permease